MRSRGAMQRGATRDGNKLADAATRGVSDNTEPQCRVYKGTDGASASRAAPKKETDLSLTWHILNTLFFNKKRDGEKEKEKENE